MAMTKPPGSVRDSLAHPAASSTSPMADGKIQTPFSEITSPGGLKCQEFGGRRGFEERHLPGDLQIAVYVAHQRFHTGVESDIPLRKRLQRIARSGDSFAGFSQIGEGLFACIVGVGRHHGRSSFQKVADDHLDRAAS